MNRYRVAKVLLVLALWFTSASFIPPYLALFSLILRSWRGWTTLLRCKESISPTARSTVQSNQARTDGLRTSAPIS